MNLGIFGGSFNPPHVGHLMLAQCATDFFSLDKVYFVPAYQSPFKHGPPSASPEDRCELLSLALYDNEKFALSTVEIDRGGISYTVDTLRTFKAQFPAAEFFLLMGADTFNEFPAWKEPDEILLYARLCVACRPGHPVDSASHPYHARTRLFEMPSMDIASSEIRERVAEGLSVRYFVPWSVLTYIRHRNLYIR